MLGIEKATEQGSGPSKARLKVSFSLTKVSPKLTLA
jgi:hypothetical protein